MSRARKTCSKPDCPNLQPCPTPGHSATPWARKADAPARSAFSGSYQQKRARWIIERDNGICHVCGYAGADQADHVIPTTEDGADDPSNMRAIHATPCHRDKTAAEAARARTRTT